MSKWDWAFHRNWKIYCKTTSKLTLTVYTYSILYTELVINMKFIKRWFRSHVLILWCSSSILVLSNFTWIEKIILIIFFSENFILFQLSVYVDVTCTRISISCSTLKKILILKLSLKSIIYKKWKLLVNF